MIKIQEKWTMKDPLNCIGYNMATCYGTKTDKEERNVKRAREHLIAHGRLQELPDIYVTIEGYSAKCLRELYTHIGCLPTRMQASTRYIDYSKGFNYITPPSVEKDPVAKETWDMTMAFIANQMKQLKQLNVPVEDLTNILPLAYESKMIWKINMRCLVNFMNMRLCSRAYWEIRNLAKELKQVLSNYSEEWKYICDLLFVPKCESTGYCTEHECCGRKPSKKDIDEILANYYKTSKESN